MSIPIKKNIENIKNIKITSRTVSSPFYGETLCSSTVRTTRKQCTNNPYYKDNNLFLC